MGLILQTRKGGGGPIVLSVALSLSLSLLPQSAICNRIPPNVTRFNTNNKEQKKVGGTIVVEGT